MMAVKDTIKLQYKFDYIGDVTEIIAKQPNGIKLFKVVPAHKNRTKHTMKCVTLNKVMT